MRISDWSSDVCSSDLNGKATAIPNVARISVNGKPPQREFSTCDRPNTPPHISMPTTTSATIQITHRKGFQNHLMQLHTMRSEERRVGKEGVSTCKSRW